MKHITLTSEAIEQYCEQVRKLLTGTSAIKDNISVSIPTKITVSDDDKPTIIVTELADRKMKALINQCLGEVAWHGSVSYDADYNCYTIEDIFVFPQDVSGSTATATDDYGLWLQAFDNETFNKIRFHGHSHVNMGVFPSGTDTTYQETLIKDVQDFYIFAIYNKKEEYNIWLYDVQHNYLYEKADLYYEDEATDVMCWAAEEIKAKVKAKTYAVTTTTTTTNEVASRRSKKEKAEDKPKDKDAAAKNTYGNKSWYTEDSPYYVKNGTYGSGWYMRTGFYDLQHEWHLYTEFDDEDMLKNAFRY